MLRKIKSLLRHRESQGHSIQDLSHADRNIIASVRAYTMTSNERLAALINALHYIRLNSLPGDIVECGVWKGGSMMAAARFLMEYGIHDKTLFLFDTFEGMTEPTEKDSSLDGTLASEALRRTRKNTGTWCYASFDDVQRNLYSTGIDAKRCRLVKGDVKNTIPQYVPGTIALLRLDTDWYESTLHELEHLYPKLVPGGVLIIDDYGHWSGARRAVDEYFSRISNCPYLHRIDYTGRLVVKSRC